MIIVTGAAGFIGSNLLAGLEEKDIYDITICDVLGTEDKWKNIAKRELRDIVRPENLLKYVEDNKNEIDVIFHLGAISATTEKDADLIAESNFDLSRKLFKWCANNHVRFIYASSCATYGNGEHGFVDDESTDYLSKLRPLNPYGWSKHVFDRTITRFKINKKEELPPQCAGLKFTNVYGPNEYHKGDMMSVICKLYPQVIKGGTAKLFKSYKPEFVDGGQSRDFIYVDDCVNVMLWLYDNPKISGLFNVGTGKARSFKDLALAVFKAVGVEPKIEYIEMPEHLKDKYQYYTQADMSKIIELGYDKKFTELEDGIAKYINDYMAKEDIYK